MSMYGWSVCQLVGASRCSLAEQLFPGCVVIVKEGDLGFLLKSCRAEHLFKEALGVGGWWGWVRGVKTTGWTHSLNIKDYTRWDRMERESDRKKEGNHKTTFIIFSLLWIVTVHFIQIIIACLIFTYINIK